LQKTFRPKAGKLVQRKNDTFAPVVIRVPEHFLTAPGVGAYDPFLTVGLSVLKWLHIARILTHLPQH